MSNDPNLVICKSCEGLGYHDVYHNEFDIEEVECEGCHGECEVEDD